MNQNNGITFINEFALGPGTIYVRRGNIPESLMEDYRYKLGDTDDGCRITYEYKTRELYDVDGNAAATLRYGEIIRIKGKLCRILRDALPCITGDAHPKLTVLFVSPLPDGDQFRILIRGGVSLGAGFNTATDGCIDFEIVGGKGADSPKFTVGGAAS